MAFIRNWIALLFITVSMIHLQAKDLDTFRKMFPRVQQASLNTQETLEDLVNQIGLSLPLNHLFIRAYKAEKALELWGSNGDEFKLIKTYEIARVPGFLGPKIRQGDKQVPEGWYEIDSLNPESSFHLSLRLNYPNQADLIRSQHEKDPGGDIFIHGDQYSVGCLPIYDDPMEEVFNLVTQTIFQFPDHKVQVLILPFDLNSDVKSTFYEIQYQEHFGFWNELKAISTYFDQKQLVPSVGVTKGGNYIIQY